MRPRRVVLCVDADEGELTRRKYVLETRRPYTVLRSSSGLSALELLRQLPPGTVAVLVTECDLGGAMDGEELVAQVRAIDPSVRSLVTSRTRAGWVSLADVYLPKSAVLGNAELLERIKILARRTTGPKREPALNIGAQRAVARAARGVA